MLRYKPYIFFIILLVVFSAISLQCFYQKTGTKARFIIESNLLDSNTSFSAEFLEPLYFDVPNAQNSAHASTILALNNPQKPFMVLYFAGSREGASDVAIYQSFFVQDSGQKCGKTSVSYTSQNPQHAPQDSQTTRKNPLQISQNLVKPYPCAPRWSEPRAILTPKELSRLSGKFIHKLGNPVSFLDTQGRVHLFVVGVSMGGWATSKIYWLLFDDTLQQLHFQKELTLSPFINFSSLVRSHPLLLDDGGFILPVYHELARKFPLLLHFSQDLQLEHITKPLDTIGTKATSKLQPSFTPLNTTQAFGVYRNYNVGTMQTSFCTLETEFLCQEPKPSNLTNHTASSIVFNALDSVLLLHNQKGREELWLYVLDKSSLVGPRTVFVPLMRLDNLPTEVSYPSVALTESSIHIAYTYGRTHIRSLLIPKSYLAQAIQNANSLPPKREKATTKGAQ